MAGKVGMRTYSLSNSVPFLDVSAYTPYSQTIL